MIYKTKKRVITINNKNFSVNGLSIDSREVCQGYAFFCIKGSLQDGHKYAQSAVEKGATLIVCEDEVIIDRENNVDIVVVEDVRETLAKCANQFFDYPSKKIKVIGITGTNGKTTTSHIVNHVICSTKKTSAVIGTTGIYINYKKADEKTFPFTGRTTSDIISTQNLLNEFVNLGIDYVVMEVSSHALDQKRVLGVKFEVCAFTNLTQDHLDYHETIENYFDAKAILFSKVYTSKKVICIDDK
jgi:UDP-N-acetylmuramoyl-L-alanyl-D-glutamate--2,6-diaminopimelate ligase